MTKRDDDELLRAKEEAMKLEEELEFDKAIEKYKIAESILLPEDGSLERYGNLLYEFGELDEAKRIFEKLTKHTNDTETLLKLAQIYEELEEIDKALPIYTKLNKEKKIAELTDKAKLHKPNENIIKKFLELFSGREDVFAVQFEGGYRPVRRPMTSDDVSDHLAGKSTLGVYVLKGDSSVKFGAYDIDFSNQEVGIDNVTKLELCKSVTKDLKEKLQYYNIKHVVEYSGNRGYHIWIFLNKTIPAYKLKILLEKIAEQVELPDGVNVEVFPKQAEHGGGLGNLIKVPLGVHRKTNNRCSFVNEDFEEIPKQLEFLLSIEPNNADEIETLYRELYDSAEDFESKQGMPNKIHRQRNISEKDRVKKILRQEIHTEQDRPYKIIAKGCHILSQIIDKIEKEAYITEEEERLLVQILSSTQNPKMQTTELLRRTINYSPKRLETLLANTSQMPIACEEIKKEIINSKIDLSLNRCNCKFSTSYNSPIAYIRDSEEKFFESIQINSIVKKIVDLNNEKFEIEKQIDSLKKIIAKRLGDKTEETTEWGKIVKNGDDINIIL
ncbi:MAG TPA: CRISPR-associated primase-polymerase type A1 [Fervidobacterium sp.]|nr:CRISPR-associated primase-polymerase type A1 [Fervidobacterium sp.]HOL03773.1 CRISPR-associated primase-polymerase type A1 [Fervidobacterium sp.]HON04353.1 CRISPR-associated primase-polymerase type A1 [Fervidobacterium sp.]HRT01495.1 CRISPR-associated primase-polymerase type A1 [Fervidobacterium sp.]HRV37893.1 CRISPR-associated primase-polymerase type A1 [Fervidobacterium sp.]